MKYKKPENEIRKWNMRWSSESDDRAIAEFINSLPAEFEIVPYGMVAVKWPKEATKESILWHADSQHGRGLIADSLYALAAIAPVEKKKRKVELWRHESWPSSMPPHAQISGASMLSDGVGGWRKVGECEVDE